MGTYRNPEPHLIHGLSRCYIASKAGAVVLPHAMDIHPVSGQCNLDCRWCIGRFQRKSIDPLPPILDQQRMVQALGKILDPRWPVLWPTEFHFCGGDSEPLLSDAVLPAIRFLLQRNRVIELITNGLLLGKEGVISITARIQKLSISLDVTNDQDYQRYKLPEGARDIAGYSQVVDNLRRVDDCRKQQQSHLHVAVTFVATPKTYNKDQWGRCFEELKAAGANEIRVRDDLNGTFGGPINNLKNDIDELSQRTPEIKVRYLSPDEPYSEFPFCRGSRLWPALAVDGCLYSCAHTATSVYRPFGDLLNADSLLKLYHDLFHPPRKGFLQVDDIGCNRECPSVLGSFNEPSLAKGWLGKEWYV